MIVVIIGPTGVGKTKLSVELAKRIDAEIINCDSMQVYKELNIGTAKVTEEEKEGIVHHLLDIVEPSDLYTVYDYQRDCRNKIKELQDKNKNIIIVGGTGLYVKAALYDYKFEQEEEKKSYKDLTNEELLEKIRKKDNTLDIHLNNRKRLERALEKLENNGTFSKEGNIKLYDFYTIGLTTDRNNLYEIINNRVDKMVKEGLLEEVESLYKRNIRSKSINTGIGYKELYKYFDKEISLEEAIDLIKKNSRHYAKRQYTFFNNQMDVKWFETNYKDFSKTIEEVYNYIKD
ncbi:MAG: tRNA (adenosine(37)-N6)-dimethylallyltransferase MiaA [Firmicutes bacterium]|nr:tRNA (adenosine(37)-N6)-dimethylallyltransferase MiaA [Bacillota bacterium]